MSLSGILVVNKSTGVTSHDVIQRLRQILHIRRIGHTGTLDPGASGVLLACIGKATKVVQFLTEYDKEYEGVIKLGITTDTYDSDGRIIGVKSDYVINPEKMAREMDSFRGEIWQIPPLYSAVRQNGKRLYQYARAKKKVERKKRKVEIKDIHLIDISQPYVKFRINCSKGTYVRSLAHDWGEKLGCGAHLFSLQRTGVGPFRLQDGFALEDIWNVQNEGKISDILVPIEKALAHLPSVLVKEEFAEKVWHGLPLVSSSVKSTERDFDQNQTISIKDQGKNIIAIGKALSSSKKFLDLNYKDKLFAYVRVI